MLASVCENLGAKKQILIRILIFLKIVVRNYSQIFDFFFGGGGGEGNCNKLFLSFSYFQFVQYLLIIEIFNYHIFYSAYLIFHKEIMENYQ